MNIWMELGGAPTVAGIAVHSEASGDGMRPDARPQLRENHANTCGAHRERRGGEWDRSPKGDSQLTQAGGSGALPRPPAALAPW